MDESELSRLLVGASADGVWLLDEDGTTLFANPRIADLLGRTPEQMIELSVYDTLDDEGQADFAEHLRQAVAGSPGEDDHPHRHLRGDGTPIWLLISWSPVHDADGALVGFLHQCSDHTQMRRQIESLEQREQLMRDSQALTRIGSWEWDVVGNHVEWSDQLYDTLGVGRDSLTDFAHYLARVHPADREGVRSAVATTFEGAKSFEFTARIIRGDDGRVRWCHGLGSVVRDQQGNPVRVVGSSQDVTERMAAEREVADSTRRLGLLRRVAEAANQSTSMVEALTTVMHALAETQGWGWSAALVRGAAGRQLVAIDLAVQVPSGGLTPDLGLADRAWQSRQLQHQPLTGTEQGRSLVAIPVLHDGGVTCVLELVCDEVPPSEAARDLIAQIATQLGRVAERERAAAELAEARDQAMEASRLKSEFLATMSHEIRTPMNGVIGLTDLLLNADLGAHERRLTEALHGAGLTLRGIINDILDLSKIEAGKLELETVDFEVRPALQQTVRLLQGQAVEKGLHLDLAVVPEVPRFLKGDAGRWMQILSNLGSNAIKFTDAGTVSIRVGLVGRDSARTVIEVLVTDTGPGIEAEAQQRLFEAFTQGDPSTTRRHGGTGLGLTIARQLVDALGGTLSVESEVGRGSTFGFTAVFTPASVTSGDRGVPHPAPDARSGVPRQRILVVEDNEVNQLVAVGLLEHAGYDVDVVGDGLEAVEALAGVHGYGAVLMDCRMPRMDGFAATRAIRAREGAGRGVPIIAMTASALAGERSRCLASGMDDFLTKPVDFLRLQQVVHQWLGVSGVGDGAGPGPHQEVPESEVPESVREVLDLDRVAMLHDMVKDGLSLFQRSSANFLAHASDHLTAIGGAMESEDAGQLMQAAHKFKGSALNLGLQRVGDVAFTLEEQGQTGTLVDSRVAFERLRTEVEVAVAALQRERDVRA